MIHHPHRPAVFARGFRFALRPVNAKDGKGQEVDRNDTRDGCDGEIVNDRGRPGLFWP